MKSVKVNINSIDKVKKFVNILAKYDGNYDLVSGRYVIDAKSIMGIFSLDLSQDIELVLQGEGNDEVIRAIDEFVVK